MFMMYNIVIVPSWITISIKEAIMADKVVIIGAGNAGIAAAYELQKADVPYVLLEGTGRYGGRTNWGIAGDIRYQEGAIYTEPQWETTFDYIREFGLEDNVYMPEKKVYGFYLNGETKYFEDTGNLFASAMQVKGLPKALLVQGAKFIPGLLKAMGKVGENHDFSQLHDLSEISTREWVTDISGPEVADELLGPMLGSMTLSRSEEICAAHPIALMKLMKGMDVVEGGLGIINDAIYEKIKDNVRLNARVKEVVIENDAIKQVILEDGEAIETDRVICCTDAYDATQIMPGLPQDYVDALNKCSYCKTYHYVYYIENPPMPDGFLFHFIPESVDSILATVHAGRLCEADRVKDAPDEGHKFDGSGWWVRAFTSGWHDEELKAMSPEEREARVRAEIDRFSPGFGEKAEFLREQRYERAINLEPPGQFNAISNLKENLLGNVKGLYLAGEYMFLIACTEGAWMTGKQAALNLIANKY